MPKPSIEPDAFQASIICAPLKRWTRPKRAGVAREQEGCWAIPLMIPPQSETRASRPGAALEGTNCTRRDCRSVTRTVHSRLLHRDGEVYGRARRTTRAPRAGGMKEWKRKNPLEKERVRGRGSRGTKRPRGNGSGAGARPTRNFAKLGQTLELIYSLLAEAPNKASGITLPEKAAPLTVELSTNFPQPGPPSFALCVFDGEPPPRAQCGENPRGVRAARRRRRV